MQLLNLDYKTSITSTKKNSKCQENIRKGGRLKRKEIKNNECMSTIW